MFARARALTACATAALGVAVAGCTTTAASSSVTGGTLSVYLSVPPNSPAEYQDVLAAERLAFQQAGSHVDKFTVRLVSFSGKEVSDNARQAIGDDTTVAYLGELAPGASEDTIGITNALDVLQVSPTDTAVEETQHTPAINNSPNHYYESLSTNNRTFARVVPTDALEAKFLVAQMQALGVKQLYVKSDGTAYGTALAHAVRSDASGAITIASSPSSADGVLYAGRNSADAVATFNKAAAGNSAVKLFAPSALALSTFAAALSPPAQRVTYVSSPGFGPGSPVPPDGQQFASAFKAAYGHAPAAQAIFGYEAMSAVMATLREAGSSASNRGTVVKDFLRIRNRSSAIGTYSINANGDTSIAPFVLSRIRSGRLVAYKAVPAQG
jgi:branched-chain amino acid transport system substrate-binding protein